MAKSIYDIKYNPLTGKDSWNAKAYATDRANASKVSQLDVSTEEGIKGLESFVGPVALTITKDEAERAKGVYSRQLDSGATEYIGANLEKAVKYVGEPNALPIILNFSPTDKRKATGKELSAGDAKYNAAAEAIEKFRKINQQTRTEPRKALDEELSGINDVSRKFWLNVLGEQGILDYRLRKAQTAATEAVAKYGVTKYLVDSTKLAQTQERDYYAKATEIETQAQKKISELVRARGGLPLSAIESATVSKPFDEKMTKLAKQYAPYVGVLNAVVNNEQVGLSGKVLEKYAKVEAENKLVQDYMKAAEKKTGKKITEGEAREALGL